MSMIKGYSKGIAGSLVFRTAVDGDVPAIAEILGQAVQRMLAEGKRQWDETYPTAKHVRADIENGNGYVLEKEGEVIGYVAVVFTGEPAYECLDGRWLSNGRYVVAHRMAVSQNVRGHGYGRIFMETIEGFARKHGIASFKVDTNFDNFAMLGLLDKLGFSYCGEIEYESGSRMAFEKLI